MNIIQKSSAGIELIPMESKMLSLRQVFVEGEITSETAQEFMKQIMYLNGEGDAPISVYINSPGGEVTAGLQMYDVIVGSNATIKTFCTGRAYSMAAILFACASKRGMLTNSELMLHEPLLGGRIGGNASSIKSTSDSLLETKAKLNRIIADITGKSEQEIDEATRFDHYFDAAEAVSFGLCDEIVTFTEILQN